MPRKYEKVEKLLPEVQRLNAEGYTYRQIAEKLGLGGKEVVKQLLQRERRKEIPGIRKQRGRKSAKTLQEDKHENKQLKMKVELLRDFLSLIGKERRPSSSTKSYTVIEISTTLARELSEIEYADIENHRD